MNGNATPSDSQRGSILIDLGRYADAESYFRDALIREPENSWLLTNLAFCELHQQRALAAFETICRAISLSPETAWSHSLKAYIEIHLNRLNDALASATQALELDPECEDAFTATTAVYIAKGEWEKAEKTARTALELNPDHVISKQQLTQVLRLQSRLRESEKYSADLLQRNPEDSNNHTAAGWILLQKGEREKAEAHFLEALRLNPNNTSAEEGLDESYFAQFPVYSFYLNHQFSMQRFAGAKWPLIYKWLNITKLLVVTGVNGLIGIALFILHIITSILTLVHRILILWEDMTHAVSHLQLLFYPSQRDTMSRMEILDACITGGNVVAGILLFAVGIILSWSAAIVLGIALVLAAFPFACTFMNMNQRRWLFGAIGAFVILVGMLNFLQILSDWPRKLWLDGISWMAVIGIFATLWLSSLNAFNSRLR